MARITGARTRVVMMPTASRGVEAELARLFANVAIALPRKSQAKNLSAPS